MKKFSINFKSHFRHLWVLIFLLIVGPIILHYMMILKKGYYTPNAAIFVGGVVFVISILPMILLHINYYFVNKNVYLCYDESHGIIKYGKGKLETSINLHDVESITCYKSWPLAENRTPVLPWDTYNYATIQLKQGDTINVSSLLVYEFDKKIKFDGIRIKKSIYPFIWKV